MRRCEKHGQAVKSRVPRANFYNIYYSEGPYALAKLRFWPTFVFWSALSCARGTAIHAFNSLGTQTYTRMRMMYARAQTYMRHTRKPEHLCGGLTCRRVNKGVNKGVSARVLTQTCDAHTDDQ